MAYHPPISGSAVPGQQRASTGMSTYGSGNPMGGIYSYGAANPYGPYATLPHGGSSSTTSTSTPGNPQNSAALKFLNSVVSGDTLPYGQQQQDALYGQASGMNAAAEAAQNNQAQDAASAGGASPNDPSLQSQYRQNMARRQTGNQRAMGDIQSKAGSENFGARSNAAGQILGAEQANLDREERQRMQAMSALSNMYGNMNNQGAVPSGGMWQYTGTSGSYGR